MAESPASAPARGSSWWPWVVIPVLIIAIGVVGYRSDQTARQLKLVSADVDALELTLDVMKKARVAASPQRLPPPTPSRTAKAGTKTKAKAPEAERTAKAGKAGKAKAGGAQTGAAAARGTKTKAKAKAP